MVKTLIEVQKNTWAKVKQFATIQEWSLNHAVDFLLSYSLGYLNDDKKEGGVSLCL